jgi:hypothetical protein
VSIRSLSYRDAREAEVSPERQFVRQKGSHVRLGKATASGEHTPKDERIRRLAEKH